MRPTGDLGLRGDLGGLRDLGLRGDLGGLRDLNLQDLRVALGL